MALDANLIKYNLDKTKFFCFDFETESLSLNSAKPWSVGFQIYHGTKLVEEKEVFINWPGLRVSPGATKATGFDSRKIELYGREPKEVIDKFNSYLYNPEYKIVGTNLLGYDVFVHNTAMRQLGYKTDYSYLSRLYDTISLSRAYKLNAKIPEDIKDLLAFQYRMLNAHQKGMKVSNSVMAKEFGMAVDESQLHGSLFDTSLSAFTFFNLIKKLDIQ